MQHAFQEREQAYVSMDGPLMNDLAEANVFPSQELLQRSCVVICMLILACSLFRRQQVGAALLLVGRAAPLISKETIGNFSKS